MNSKKRNTLITLFMLGLLLLPVLPVQANAGPPPTDLWLTFEYDTATTLEGFQLIGCETSVCENPIVLEQYGVCDAPECLAVEPEPYDVQEPECLDNTCVVNLYIYDYDIAALKVVGQFSDGIRESDFFEEEVTQYGSFAWRVTVEDEGLSVAVDDDFELPYGQYSNFFEHYAFTIVVELIVAALLLLVWLKLKKGDLFTSLIYVLLANIVSYPVTWFFWPALAQLQPKGNRTFGWAIVILAALYTAYLVITSLTKDKARLVMTIIAFVLLPIVVFVAALVAFTAFYGNYAIAMQGIPLGLSIALAEVFAFIFEFILIYLLARKPLELKWWQVAIISVVMNAVSYGLGFLVL